MADEKQTFTVAGYKFATKGRKHRMPKDELNAIKVSVIKDRWKRPKTGIYVIQPDT